MIIDFLSAIWDWTWFLLFPWGIICGLNLFIIFYIYWMYRGIKI